MGSAGDQNGGANVDFKTVLRIVPDSQSGANPSSFFSCAALTTCGSVSRELHHADRACGHQGRCVLLGRGCRSAIHDGSAGGAVPRIGFRRGQNGQHPDADPDSRQLSSTLKSAIPWYCNDTSAYPRKGSRSRRAMIRDACQNPARDA